jgi:sterol desaturase/sphingolipid hydroxylase (fatty acid hydroxylase superfamily)
MNVPSTIGLFAIIGCLLSTAEWANPIDLGSAGRDRSVGVATRTDGAWFLVYLAYAPIIGIAALRLTDTISQHHSLTRTVSALSLPIRSFGAALVCELFAYFCHRLMHRVPILWRFHAIHHGARHPRWFTAFRFHPIDGILSSVVPILIASFVGFDRSALSAYLTVVFITTLFAHADVWLPSRWLSELVATPFFHRRHHQPGSQNSNFALVLPVFDRLFGTRADDMTLPKQRQTDRERDAVCDDAHQHRQAFFDSPNVP